MVGGLKKGAVLAAALALALPLSSVATPVAAQGWHGGGWHGGGWHGGGWGGGWHGGGWGWRGGGWGWGGPAAAGLIGGLALGGLATSVAPYGSCYVQYQPVLDAWGQFAGYRPVRMCY